MLIELVTLGRDSELRITQTGTPILSFAAAYDIGFGQNKKTQWIDCAIFGKKGESLVDHLKKGKQIQISAKDVRIESWEKNDGSGTGFKLACTVEGVKFCRDGTGGQQSQHGGYGQQQGSYNQVQHQAAPQPASQQSYQQPPPQRPIVAQSSYASVPHASQQGSYQQPQQNFQNQQPPNRSQPAPSGDSFDDD